jgi:excisionase family DNA binding protein
MAAGELEVTDDSGVPMRPADTAQMSEWLTATEAAHYLKVKVRTLLLWARQGKIKGHTLSGTKRRVWRFRRADLDAALMESPVLPSMVPSVLVKGIS